MCKQKISYWWISTKAQSTAIQFNLENIVAEREAVQLKELDTLKFPFFWNANHGAQELKL